MPGYTNALLASLNARETLRHYSSRVTGPQDLATTSSVVFYRPSEEPPAPAHASSAHQTLSLRTLGSPVMNKGSEEVLDAVSLVHLRLVRSGSLAVLIDHRNRMLEQVSRS
jgi:hypothetical protein